MRSKRSDAKKVERLVELFTDGWEDWQDLAQDEEDAIAAAKEEEEKMKKRKAALLEMKKHEGHRHTKARGQKKA